MAPPELQILVRWPKTHQSVGQVPFLLILEVPGHPWTRSQPTIFSLLLRPPHHRIKTLLTYLHWGCCTPVTVLILSRALAALLHDLGYDAGLFTLHSLCRGGAMVAYRQGLDQIGIRCQGLWTSDAFWQYITSSCPATSQRDSLAPSTTPPPACPPLPTPPPLSHSSSLTHNHHQVAICHSSSPHHSRHHHHFMCANQACRVSATWLCRVAVSRSHALSGCGSCLSSILDNPVCSHSRITQCI